MECPHCSHSNSSDSRFCSNCGRALEAAPTTPLPARPPERGPESGFTFTPGQKFGSRYQIIEEIGRGGMGVVYKAVDEELGRVVALKMIKPGLTSDPGILERFKQELLLASEVSHENVIRIHDLGEAEGIKYISMKFIDGTSLKELVLTAGRLMPDRAVAIARQIAGALVAAHRQGVIHRDLKPQNIMLDQIGRAYVMDFGIAKAVGAEDSTARGLVVGTPEYISPEQAGGTPADERSDIYSFGCIIYEMLAGRKPFSAESARDMLSKHMSEDPVPPSRFSPGLPAMLERIVLKCLEKSPARRYSSAAELLSAFESALGGQQAPAIRRAPPDKEETSSTASLAVMPFRDMSPEKDQEYFCDGMAEEIINALVKVDGLRVAALTSSFQFKGRDLDIREIGEKLNVGTVLEGSVRKAGNRLRVTVQLVNVSDGYHIWSERYDREMEDVFEIQDEISTSIAEKLKLRFAGEQRRQPADRATQNLEAYNLYLKGRFYWNKRTDEGITKGIECFKQAIEKDPTYAPAYAGLADSYTMLESMPSSERLPKGRAAALKALELDEGLAEAYVSLGWISFGYEWDVRAALKHFHKALELNPNYATAHQWYGLILMNIGRTDEAIREAERARELDPLSIIINAAVGVIYFYTGDYDVAEEELERVLEMDPGFGPAHVILGWMHAVRGDYERAIEELRAGLEAVGDPRAAEVLEEGFRESGYEGAIRAMREHVLEETTTSGNPNMLAAEYSAMLGEQDLALEYLERAMEARENELVFIRVTPGLDKIRSDPRYLEILKRIGLSDDDIRDLPL
ncbi:MAG: protein kinase [bacterium]|jgi:serine/threonine-protein kinase